MSELVSSLSDSGSADAAYGIMTTDTVLKEVAVEFEIGGKTCRIGGIAKGSGMIHPNMATMLVFITTDCAITSEMLDAALKEDVEDSFNMISVDGDTSTKDSCFVLANGASLVDCSTGEAKENFAFALDTVLKKLAIMLVKDGEGAEKLIEVEVVGAVDTKNAKILARSIISSNLVKAAFFGSDANWGRILCAMGYSNAEFDPSLVDLYFKSQKGEIHA